MNLAFLGTPWPSPSAWRGRHFDSWHPTARAPGNATRQSRRESDSLRWRPESQGSACALQEIAEAFFGKIYSNLPKWRKNQASFHWVWKWGISINQPPQLAIHSQNDNKPRFESWSNSGLWDPHPENQGLKIMKTFLVDSRQPYWYWYYTSTLVKYDFWLKNARNQWVD